MASIVLERRKRVDRRRIDCGPPKSCAERRRAVERRKPGIEELEMSAAEWEAFFPHMAEKRVRSSSESEELAAQVLERVRD